MAGLPPWHLWGDSKLLEPISGGGALSPTVSSNQIVRVNYGRPETWRFLFAAKLLGGIGPGGSPVNPGNVVVTFNVTTGVGRQSVTLNAFEQYKFQWNALAQAQKYSTDVIGPARDDSAAPLVDNNNRIDLVSGEDIQVDASAILTTNQVGDTVQVQVYAFFTPNVHTRPEWHEQRFPGDETEGR